jgi:hypothetical protein
VKPRPQAPRIGLRPEEAAAAYGLSPSSFDRYVAPHLRWARFGRTKVVAVTELERFLADHSALTLERDRP